MIIFPQPLMLALTAAIPFYFIYLKKKHDLVVAWLALITVFDIFNSQLYMNLAAILIFGVVTIPYLWKMRADLIRNPALKVFVVYLIYLSLLGVYHGFIFPWPDPTGLRSVKDQAQFRTILHLGRTFCEWAAIFYLALQLERDEKNTLATYLKTIFYGSIILAISAFLEKTLQIDFYHFFTGGRELLLSDRPRGFAYEPRGLAQNLSYAILLTPFVPLSRWKYLAIPFFAFFAIFFTISFAGLAVLGTGLFLGALGFCLSHSETVKRHYGKLAVLSGAIVLILASSLYALPKHASSHITERFNYLFESNFAEKLEVFDAASINFLNHNPKYYPLGTGPGLIYLPAGDYILERDKAWGNHFEALPHMGAVLTISNAGFLGLLILLFGIWIGLKDKRRYYPTIFMLGLLLVGIYMVQLRYYYVLGFACVLAFPRTSKTTS